MIDSPQDSPPAPPTERKKFLTALLLSIYFGWFGVDRFYLGYFWKGVLKLLTFGACGVWHSVDIILIATEKLKDARGKDLER